METKIKSLKGVNFKYKFFHDSVMTVIDKHVPFKESSNKDIKDMKKPWVTKGIKAAIKKRNKFLETFIKTSDEFWYIKYKNHRNKINHLIRKSKKNHYNQFFSNITNDIKKNLEGNKQDNSQK